MVLNPKPECNAPPTTQRPYASKAHGAKALQLLQDYMAAHDGAAPVI